MPRQSVYSLEKIKAFISERRPFFRAIFDNPDETLNWLSGVDRQQARFFKTLLKQIASYYFHDQSRWVDAGVFYGQLLQNSYFFTEKELIKNPDLLDLLTLFDKATIKRYASHSKGEFSSPDLDIELLHFHYDASKQAFVRRGGSFLSLTEDIGLGEGWISREIHALGRQDDIIYHQVLANFTVPTTRRTRGQCSPGDMHWLMSRQLLLQRVVAYRLTQVHASQLLLVQQIDGACHHYEMYLWACLERLQAQLPGHTSQPLMLQGKFSKQMKSIEDKLSKLTELRGLLRQPRPSVALQSFKQVFFSDTCQGIMQDQHHSYAAVFVKQILNLLSRVATTFSHLFRASAVSNTPHVRFWSVGKDQQYLRRIQQPIDCGTGLSKKLRV